jgi:hypothetical protein
LLTFPSSAFLLTRTLPMPLRAYADHQPLTAAVNTIRPLLPGGPTAHLVENREQAGHVGFAYCGAVFRLLLRALGRGIGYYWLLPWNTCHAYGPSLKRSRLTAALRCA